jgi:hypothetical protein
MRCASVLSVLLAVPSIGAVAQTAGAELPRTVRIEPSLPDDLLKVVRVTVANAEIKPGVAFRANDDWFGEITVVFKNISTKRILFVEGQLRFPETGDATPEHLAVMERIVVGQRPDHAKRSSAAGRSFRDAPGPSILVDPGQEISLSTVDPIDHVRRMIETRQALATVTTCVVGINRLYFDDGTEWLSGLYLRADPSTPGRYVRISRREFEASGQVASQ